MINLLVLNPLETVVGIVVWISALIYQFASWSFEIFLILASGEVIDSDKYQLLIQNFYIVLGIVVLFFISFSLLRSMVNPDDKKSGTTVVKTSIINLVTSVAILALLPTIFGFMYDFQTSFITRYNVIGRFFGYGNLAEPADISDLGTWLCKMNNKEIRQGAYQIVNGVYTAFFNVNTNKCNDEFGIPVTDDSSLLRCQEEIKDVDSFLFIPMVNKNKSFADTIIDVDKYGFFSQYIDFTDNVINGQISFNFLLSIVAGIILIYVGISYCFDMALRMVKLVFYQIIAPIPIFARVVPDGPLKGSFEKWLKIVVACYLEVFIRIFVFYFVIYLCKAMLSSKYLSNILLCFGPFMWLTVRALLLMGFVTFMRQAPKLISNVTGIDSGNMKLGIRDKLRDGGFFAAGSAVGSYVANRLAGGSVGSALVSAWKGGKDGWKNPSFKSIGAGAAAGRAYKQAIDNGATARGIRMNAIRGAFGFDTTADAEEREIKSRLRKIKNTTNNAFTYKDKDGVEHQIIAGAEFNATPVSIADLDAQILANKGAIAEKNEAIKKIDEQKSWSDSQKGLKSFFDDDSEKAWKNGKFKHHAVYTDENGNITEKDLDYEEFIKIRERGASFYDKTHLKVNYTDSSGVNHSETINTSDYPEKLMELSRQGATDIDASMVELTSKKVMDEAKKNWTTSELSASGPTGAKTQLETFLDTLQQEGGFSYREFEYDSSGMPVRDEHGNIKIKSSGTYTSGFNENGRRTITSVIKTTDQNGNDVETEIVYTESGNGQYSYEENGETKYISSYDISDAFDKAAKNNAAVLDAEKGKIRTQSENGNPSLIELQGANKAMESIKTQYAEQQTADLQNKEQRAREAEKKYHSNGGK